MGRTWTEGGSGSSWPATPGTVATGTGPGTGAGDSEGVTATVAAEGGATHPDPRPTTDWSWKTSHPGLHGRT